MPCLKVPYDSRADAKRSADKCGNGRLKPYKCNYCGMFHLTSQTAKERRSMKRNKRKMQALPQSEAEKVREALENERSRKNRERQRATVQ